MSPSVGNALGARFCCPTCGSQISPESLEPAESRLRPPCGHVLWFVRRPMGGDWVVVALVTELISERDTIKQVGEVLAATGGGQRLVLDLSRLRFLPSSVLKLLLALQRRLQSLGGVLVVCGLHPGNYNALRRARLTTVLSIRDDPESLVS